MPVIQRQWQCQIQQSASAAAVTTVGVHHSYGDDFGSFSHATNSSLLVAIAPARHLFMHRLPLCLFYSKMAVISVTDVSDFVKDAQYND